MKFPHPTKDDVQTVYREETDKPLPENPQSKDPLCVFLNRRTRGKIDHPILPRPPSGARHLS